MPQTHGWRRGLRYVAPTGAEFLKRLLTQDTSTRVAARSGHKIKALTVPHVPQKRHLCPKLATLHRKFIFNS